MMAFMGVRSSWDMLARKADLWRLASSSIRPFSVTSRYSRACSMAMVVWLANVVNRLMCRSSKPPGVLRTTTTVPMTRSSRSMGTESTAR